jgi:3-oxoacyl-[acyl-carrier protein] reductase
MSSSSITLVTGASKGIGQSIALTLASHETTIVCVARQDQKGLMETTELIQSQGYQAYPVLCDLTSPEQVQDLFEEIKALRLPLKTVINNAGVSLIKLFTETSYEDWQHVINTNLTSAFNVCKEAVPLMLQHKDGHIINISSIWGTYGASMEVAYSTSKGGLNAFTKALAKELGPSNIKVNAISCGVIQTSMNAFLNDEEKQALTNDIPMCRFGEPVEVSRFIQSIIASGSYLTGQIIGLDGGF